MKNLIKAMVLTCSFAAITALASNDIAVVDLNQVFQQTPQGQATFARLQQQTQPQATQLQDQQNTLIQDVKNFETNKTKLSNAEVTSQQTQLSQQQAKFQQSVNNFNADIKQQQQVLLGSFSNSMKIAVTKVAKADGYHVVLSSQEPLYNDSAFDLKSVDITQQVIKIMNEMN